MLAFKQLFTFLKVCCSIADYVFLVFPQFSPYSSGAWTQTLEVLIIGRLLHQLNKPNKMPRQHIVQISTPI